MQLVKGLIYSNLFVAAVLLFFTLNTYFFLDKGYDSNYLVFIAASSFGLYSIHGILGLKHIPSDSFTSRHRWIERHKTLSIIMAFIAASVSGFALLNLDQHVILLVGPAILLGALYVLPLFKGRRLRDFPFVKLIIISMVVCYLCCYVPMGQDTRVSWLFLLERFLFLLAVTLPFDIRDQRIDNRNGDRNLVLLIGQKASLWFSTSILFLVLLMNMQAYQVGLITLDYFILQTIAIGIAILINLYHSRFKLNEWQYAIAYEGTLLLPGLLLLVLSL